MQPFLWICQGGHFCILIGPKNTNLVEDFEILLPVKIFKISFSGSRGKVENVSANERPGGHVFFSDRPKNTNLVKDNEILLPVSFIEFRSEEKSKMSQPIGGKSDHLFFRSVRKTQTWFRTLRSCYLSNFIEFRSVVLEKSKMSRPIRGQGGHLCFL